MNPPQRVPPLPGPRTHRSEREKEGGKGEKKKRLRPGGKGEKEKKGEEVPQGLRPSVAQPF